MSHVYKIKKKKKEGKKKDKKKKKSKVKKKGNEGGDKQEGREKRERERKGKKISLLSKIYGNWIVGFRWSKMQSRSTHQELRMRTKIFEFRQTP